MLIHDIALVVSETQAGIVSQPDGRYALHVPPGMEGMPPRKAFALLYKTFRVFRHTASKAEHLAPLDGERAGTDKGYEADEDGHYAFRDALGLDELFEQTDEMRLLTLLQRRGRSAAIVHDRIDRHLHLALFDEDGAPYLERVPGQRRTLGYESGDIVGLYCFVAEDFYRRFLGIDIASAWGRFTGEGLALAADFRHRHLHDGASLYEGKREDCERVRDVLRHALQTIDRRTSFRPPAYRELFEALERYLHGGARASAKGLVWGVKNFWAVWESVCLVYVLSRKLQHCHTCDYEHLPYGASTPNERKAWLQVREQLFARNEYERRPDLLLLDERVATIVDVKCYAAPPPVRPKEKDGAIDKQERDFLNIETYGLMLQNHYLKSEQADARQVKLEFWLPGATHASVPCTHAPAWDPPLCFVTLPSATLFEAYATRYRAS